MYFCNVYNGKKWQKAMKNINFIVLFCICACGNLFSQTLQNEIFNMSACGLDYTQASIKVTNRDSAMSSLPEYQVKGAGLPVKLSISGIPSECVQIEKAYIWMTYSHQKSETIDRYDVAVTNPKMQKIDFKTELAGTSGHTGWGDESGKYNYRTDVTSAIDGNGEYTINTNANPYYLDGITLFVIYRQLNADFQGHLVINDGVQLSTSSNEFQGKEFIDDSVGLSGLNVCESTNDSRAFMLVSDLQTKDGVVSSVYSQWGFNGNEQKYVRQFYNFETYENIHLSQGQKDFSFFVRPDPDKYITDRYSIALIGVYCRTKNCFQCEGLFDSQINSSAESICKGEMVEISIEVPPEYADQPITYSWTSQPEGFVSSDATIQVQPLETTTYIVYSTIGNGCLFSHTEKTVVVNELPQPDAGDDVKLCGTASAILKPSVTTGTPPYQYEWSPAEGLSATDIEQPTVITPVERMYYLKVTDANGCVGYDSVSARIYELEQPEIQINGMASICECDSTVLSTSLVYSKYLWNTGDTTRSIVVREAGTYSVSVTDSNDCSNSSEIVEITTFSPRTVVSLNDTLIYAKPGDYIEIPLKVLNAASNNLLECGLSEYEAKICFNRTVLVPVQGTPFGEIIEPDRIITVSGRRNFSDSLLMNLRFRAVLGDTDFVKVRLDTFAWKECPGEIIMLDSAVQIVNLCYEGGTRLFDSQSTNNYLRNNYPNPVVENTNIEFGILAKSDAEILITDMSGREVKKYSYTGIEPGNYVLNLRAIDFPTGNYIYTLKVGKVVISRLMMVVGK